MNSKYRNGLRAGFVALLFAAVGCGDDPEETPAQKCEMLASAHCNRLAECGGHILNYFPSAAAEREFIQDCENVLGDECSGVLSVETTFDTCLGSLPSATCMITPDRTGSFTPDVVVPPVCEGTLNFR